MLWQTTFDGSGNGNDYGVQLKINSSNDIFVACVVEGTSSSDFGILKYSSSGSLTWSNSWNGSNNGDDIPSDLDIDNLGNVYIVGGTETSNTFSDYAIVKFNAAGTFGWASTYDYANLHDAATSVTFDNSKVIVTGASASSTTE